MRELTEQEKEFVLSLPDPDAPTETKYGWDELFQRHLLSLLLVDRFFLIQALSKIEPGYFSNDAHILIAKTLFSLFKQYKNPPEAFILKQEIKEKIKDKDPGVQLYYLSELDALYEYYVPGVESREILIDKITNFAKVQAVKTAFHKSLDKMKEAPEANETWTYVYDLMRQAMLVDRDYETGLEYFPNIEEMFKRMKEKKDGAGRFTVGFDSIDDNLTGGGLFVGELGAWIGLAGTGKSLMLAKAAVANVLLGYKVLYLTMEMDEVGVASRFTSMFNGLNINCLLDFEKEIKENISAFVKDKDDANLLIVKQFPGGMLDMNGLRAYHSQLCLEGWKPNLVIVDYVGEMKHDPKLPTHESAYRILRDLRAFGVEEQHCTLTCVQPNATATKLEIGQYIDESNIGTSFDQFKPLDAFWSLNQQVIEKDAEVARGFVIKHRNGKSRFPFYIGIDYSSGTLNTYEISRDRYHVAMSQVQEKKAEEVVFDKKPKKFKAHNDSEGV